jgi:hypothetical protein
LAEKFYKVPEQISVILRLPSLWREAKSYFGKGYSLDDSELLLYFASGGLLN